MTAPRALAALPLFAASLALLAAAAPVFLVSRIGEGISHAAALASAVIKRANERLRAAMNDLRERK